MVSARRLVIALVALTGFGVGAGALVAQPPAAPPAASPAAGAGLDRFASDAELKAFLANLARKLKTRRAAEPVLMPPPAMAPAPGSSAESMTGAPQVVVTGAKVADGITNNQVQGVDEGDIVKVRGNTLVILRRGRLFTVDLSGGGMKPVSSIDAYPPGVDAGGDWYDEMLLSGDRVIVIGYSYQRGGTQVNRFHLDAAGRLAFEDSYQLRSSDYYSSRNYASRLIGTRLVLYSPLPIREDTSDPLDSLPALRMWRPGQKAGDPWQRIGDGPSTYVPRILRTRGDLTTLHAVTNCDLTAPVLDCKSTAVLGADARTFFVSENAVYLWISDAWGEPRKGLPDAILYRLPLDGGRPSAVQVRGSPVDQFSFSPDARRGLLHVVVRADGAGDRMWRPEVSGGAVALIDVPMTSFGEGDQEVPLAAYRDLPKPAGGNFHNRFIGDYLLYAGGSYGGTETGTVTIVPLGDGSAAVLPVKHQIDRIEPIGSDAMLVGGGAGALGFTAVSLGTGGPKVDTTFMLAEAAEGETRSHAFFFRADDDTPDGRNGFMGLPVARASSDPMGRFLGSSAAMLFLRRQSGQLAEAGQLASGYTKREQDGCVASCVDWYGNARPIFWQGRVFALLGYELVEGRLSGPRIGEKMRVSFAPALAKQ